MQKIRIRKPLLILKSDKPIYLSVGYSETFLGLSSCTEKHTHIGLSTIARDFYPEVLLHELNETAIFDAIIKVCDVAKHKKQTDNISHFMNCLSLNQYYAIVEPCKPFSQYIDSDRLVQIEEPYIVPKPRKNPVLALESVNRHDLRIKSKEVIVS